jgi:outer membrane protein assembly factor BamB
MRESDWSSDVCSSDLPHIGQVGYSGEYIDGMVLAGASSTHMTAYNATNGEIIWDSDEGGRAFFAYGGAVAYGKLFQHNIAVPEGYFAAWDLKTGTKLWSIPAYYMIGYNVPVVADHKVYCILSDGSTTSGRNATPTSFACMDEATGAIIWQIPTTFSTPIIAYGNLYGVANGAVYCMGGTAQDWTGFMGNQANIGISYSGSPAVINYPKWSFETGGPITGSAAVSNGRVYFGSTDKNIYCLDAFSGAKIWNKELGYQIRSTPAIIGNVLYTGADDGNIYALDASNGNQIWKTFAGGKTDFMFTSTIQLRSSPIIDGNNLVVGAIDGKVYCLNTADGNVKWTVQTNSAVGATAAISKGVVYIDSADGTLLAINEANGDIIWNATVPGGTDLGKICMFGTPTVAEGRVYIENGQEYFVFFGPPAPAKFFAFNQTTGALLFNATISGGADEAKSFVYYNGLLYGSIDMYAAALNASDGKPVWRQWLGHQVFSTPALDTLSGRLYIGCDSYGIQCLDMNKNGSALSVYTTGAQVQSSPALWDGKLYVGSMDYKLYCFDDAPTEEMSISTNVPSSVNSGSTVTVTGKLNPGAVANAQITVTFIKPDGTADQKTTTTDNMGKFTVTYTPPASGTYSVIASYDGYQSKYYSYSTATSQSTPLVVGGSTTTNPTQITTVTTPPSETTSTQPTSTSNNSGSLDMTTIAIIVAAVIIVIIIVAAVVLRRRK